MWYADNFQPQNWKKSKKYFILPLSTYSMCFASPPSLREYRYSSENFLLRNFIFWFNICFRDFETFVHLLKAALGSGILSMPYAFKCSGLAVGLAATLVTAFVCTYCSYLLVRHEIENIDVIFESPVSSVSLFKYLVMFQVKCAHSLYRRLNIPKMSYADVAEYSFANGPSGFRRWAKTAR